MPSCFINGVRYHWEAGGSGAPLVLLHGFTGSCRSWRYQIEALSRQFQVIRIDLLGHGQTESPASSNRYAMPIAAADLYEMINEISDTPVNLLGYSMGGRLALFFACHYPSQVASLVLESASPGLNSAGEREKRCISDAELAAFIQKEGTEAFVDFWEMLPIFSSQQNLQPEPRQLLRKQRLDNKEIGLANSLLGMGAGNQLPLWSMLPSMHLDTLLVTGSLDAKFADINQRMADLIPNSQLESIDRAGHTVHLERPKKFSDLVVRFLINQIS